MFYSIRRVLYCGSSSTTYLFKLCWGILVFDCIVCQHHF